MAKTGATAFILMIFGAVFAFSGCTRPKPVEHDKTFPIVYAKLMLLHEQDKINLQVSDSVYRTHVQEFLKSNGMSEADFRQKSAVLSKDAETWRAFLADVSLVFDSLKIARPQPPM